MSVFLWILAGLSSLHGYYSAILTEFSLFLCSCNHSEPYLSPLRHEVLTYLRTVSSISIISDRDSYMPWLPKLNLILWKLQKKSCEWVGKPKGEGKQGLKTPVLIRSTLLQTVYFPMEKMKICQLFSSPWFQLNFNSGGKQTQREILS